MLEKMKTMIAEQLGVDEDSVTPEKNLKDVYKRQLLQWWASVSAQGR